MFKTNSWWNRISASPARKNGARLRVELLEDRIAPATDLTATLLGTSVTFAARPTTSDDSLVLFTNAKGYLHHDLFSQNVPGFESNIDLDSSTPGVQAMKVARLTAIHVDTGAGSDQISIRPLGRTALDITLNAVEVVDLRTGTGKDLVQLGAHDGHLDVEFSRKDIHIVGADEVIVDTQAGADRVTIGAFTGTIVPGEFDIRNAEVVSLSTGDGADAVTLAPHGGHLDVSFGGIGIHVQMAREFVLDLQGGADSLIVEDLSSANVPRDMDFLGAESVEIRTGDGNNKVALRAHQGHLDVAIGKRSMHLVSPDQFTLDTRLGNDSVVVSDLSTVAGIADVYILNAASTVLHTTKRDDQVEIGAHDGHLDVELPDREFHFLNAQSITVDTGAGNDQVVVNDVSSIAPPHLILKGGAGSDVYRLLQGAGLVNVQDSLGVNTLDFSGFTSAGVLVNLASLNTAQVVGGDVTLWLGSLLFNVIGTEQADVILGNSRNNLIDGRGGDDRLVGMGGADILLGGAGSDQLFGGLGDDILIGGIGSNLLDGGPGNDLLLN